MKRGNKQYTVAVPATIYFAVYANSEKEALDQAQSFSVDRDDEQFYWDKAEVREE